MIESIFLNPWIWIIPILIAALLALLIVSIYMFIQDDDWLIGIVLSGFTVLVLGVWYFAGTLPPYDPSFYQTYRITGTLTQVDAAFTSEGGVASQTYIAEVDGITHLIRSDDQRFRTLHAGDAVTLVCTKGFAYFQEPWYDCSIGAGVTR